MYGYPDHYPAAEITPEMSLAETIGSSMAPTGVRLPSSPSQFEAVTMDMRAYIPQETSPPHYPQQVVGSWEDDIVKPVRVKEEQSDSGSDWGGTLVSTEESPPKPRRGRLPMNDDKVSVIANVTAAILKWALCQLKLNWSNKAGYMMTHPDTCTKLKGCFCFCICL